MTNGDRIRTLDNEGIAEEMLRFGRSEIMRHIDLKAWLDSEDPEYPVVGRDAVLTESNGEKYGCKVVGTRSIYGNAYYDLVMDEGCPFGSRIMSVPQEHITITE